MSLRDEVAAFQPDCPQEEKDKNEILWWLDSGLDVYNRTCTKAHLTASAWIVSPDKEMVLMAYHKLYDSWAWLGGHCDGEKDPKQTALKEVREESGLANVALLSDKILSLEVLTVDGHEKNGSYVSSHLHLNLTYLAEADPAEPVRAKEDENTAVRWFLRDEAVKASSEPWFRERIYSKLNRKLEIYDHGPGDER